LTSIVFVVVILPLVPVAAFFMQFQNGGRSELAAFFLEDLLPPQENINPDSSSFHSSE